uniref:Uncharacterized protein n=1 Tax=Amphimedon queenslandica TaxID=400682 RepID=A0A1X7TN97_AMPQE
MIDGRYLEVVVKRGSTLVATALCSSLCFIIDLHQTRRIKGVQCHSHGVEQSGASCRPLCHIRVNELHTDTAQRLHALCAEWNDKLSLFKGEEEDTGRKEEDTGHPSHEVIDDTTVGQAQLIMTQKLKQYLQLMQQAEDPQLSLEQWPKISKGFWDTVNSSVEYIYMKFSKIRENSRLWARSSFKIRQDSKSPN